MHSKKHATKCQQVFFLHKQTLLRLCLLPGFKALLMGGAKTKGKVLLDKINNLFFSFLAIMKSLEKNGDKALKAGGFYRHNLSQLLLLLLEIYYLLCIFSRPPIKYFNVCGCMGGKVLKMFCLCHMPATNRGHNLQFYMTLKAFM